MFQEEESQTGYLSGYSDDYTYKDENLIEILKSRVSEYIEVPE